MWISYYIASMIIAIILLIKDWKEINEFLDDFISSDDDKALMIFIMIVFAPLVILLFIITSCINLCCYIKNYHTNKKKDINKQLNKLPRLMAEYDRLLRKPEVNKRYESHIECVKLRNWDEK